MVLAIPTSDRASPSLSLLFWSDQSNEFVAYDVADAAEENLSHRPELQTYRPRVPGLPG